MKRYRIGLKFEYNDNWIGGTYYFMNLIQVFKDVNDDKKPQFVIFSNSKDFEFLVNQTNYEYLELFDIKSQKLSKLKSGINKISIAFLGKKIYNKEYFGKLDKLFLMRWTEYFSKINVDKIIFWIPDFQHKYFPELFSNENLNSIESNFKWIMRNGENVVFSSFDAMKDWDVFYPENKSTNHVVQFAVKHPEYQSISISSLREKFDIEGDYFMSPNQFWKHKNHSVIIEAVSELKKRNIKVAVLFSGKEVDNRNKEYVPSLKLKVKQLGLEKEIRFLGFLDRREQLKLMKESLAIIQPSKFEGWSTVIEDAMAIQKAVIASNLDVNIEQLGAKGIYFSPDSPVQLADILMNFNKNSSNVDYLYADKFSAYQNAVMEALL